MEPQPPKTPNLLTLKQLPVASASHIKVIVHTWFIFVRIADYYNLNEKKAHIFVLLCTKSSVLVCHIVMSNLKTTRCMNKNPIQ
jgi:hypothetical protein